MLKIQASNKITFTHVKPFMCMNHDWKLTIKTSEILILVFIGQDVKTDKYINLFAHLHFFFCRQSFFVIR